MSFCGYLLCNVGLRKLWLNKRLVYFVVCRLVGFCECGYDGVRFSMILIFFLYELVW